MDRNSLVLSLLTAYLHPFQASTSLFPSSRRTGKMSSRYTSKPPWASPSVCTRRYLVSLLCKTTFISTKNGKVSRCGQSRKERRQAQTWHIERSFRSDGWMERRNTMHNMKPRTLRPTGFPLDGNLSDWELMCFFFPFLFSFFSTLCAVVVGFSNNDTHS